MKSGRRRKHSPVAVVVRHASLMLVVNVYMSSSLSCSVAGSSWCGVLAVPHSDAAG